ncbi:MAG TPA: response regulator, partial [Nitrospiria bacterium]
MTPQAEKKPRSILVVDDDPAIAELLTTLSGHILGCEVKSADSGEAAIDLLASRDFDVIFLDIKMPMLDGKDLF